MSEEKSIIIHQNEGVIGEKIGLIQLLAQNCNEALEIATSSEMNFLQLRINADFILKFIKEVYKPSGRLYIDHFLTSHELEARFGGNGLVLNKEEAYKIFRLPDLPKSFINAISGAVGNMRLGAKLESIQVNSEGKIIPKQSALQQIERSYTTKVYGEEAEHWERLQQCTSELNDILTEHYGSIDMYTNLDDIFQLIRTELGQKIVLLPTALPSILKNQRQLKFYRG